MQKTMWFRTTKAVKISTPEHGTVILTKGSLIATGDQPDHFKLPNGDIQYGNSVISRYDITWAIRP